MRGEPQATSTGGGGPRETAGSTTRLILGYVRQRLGDAGVARTVSGAGVAHTVAELEDEDRWFSYDEKIALFEAAADELGDPLVARHVGESVLAQRVGARQKLLIRALGSPRRVLLAVPWVAPKLSTALEMTAKREGATSVVVTARVPPRWKPHRMDCDYNIGLLSQAGPLFGLPPLHVEQLECQVDGAERCSYRVTWRARSWAPWRLWRSRRAFLRDQLATVTGQFEALQRTASDLVSAEEVTTVLERIATRAAGAVQGRRWLLVVQLQEDQEPHVLAEGLGGEEVERLRRELGSDSPDEHGGRRLVVDIEGAGRHYGRLAVLYDDVSYIPAERALLETYARYVAAALEAATALDDARRGRRTASLLLELAGTLAGARTMAQVAETLAAAAAEIVGCDTAAVFLWDPERDAAVLAGSHGVTPEISQALEALTLTPEQSEGMQLLMGSHESRVVTPATVRNEFGRWLVDEFSAGMLAAYPLVAHGDFYGLLAARWSTSGAPADDADLRERLSGLADQGATALENTALLEQVRHQALHDSLTGLANRELLRDRISQAVARARRHGEHPALLYIDLDRFKKVNDELGHEVGNDVLRQVAERIRQGLRAEDSVARLGGDEFAVLLPSVKTREDAMKVAAGIVRSLRAPLEVCQGPLVVTASVGVAVFPQGGLTGETLLRNADQAMYMVKQRGRNDHLSYSADLGARAGASLAMESDLRRAVGSGELIVHYQPEIEVATGQVAALEALARWQHPAHGLLGPDRFIALAEESGLIADLDRSVLASACSQARAWLDEGISFGVVAVNVSGHQIERPEFPELVAAILAESRLDPGHLEVEVTENVAIGDDAAARSVIEELKQLGVRVAIDDFGTRYSILGRLRHYPVDKLKIDRLFIEEIRAGHGGAPIVSAMIAMARSLGLEVVAEGVETAEQLAFLARHDCDLAQGFHFTRPIPASDVPALMVALEGSIGPTRLPFPTG